MTNPVAERALETRDGLFLHQDRLVATGAGKAALQHALSRLFDHRDPLDSEALQLTRPGGRHWNLLMRCTAARPGLDERVSRTVLVLFRDAAGTREVNEELLMELFGLTRAEAVLTKRLVEGESLAEISTSLGRSRHTTRAQLAAIFSKTGVKRQPQLVSHVLNAAQQMWGE